MDLTLDNGALLTQIIDRADLIYGDAPDLETEDWCAEIRSLAMELEGRESFQMIKDLK